jgi:hypothetical protein
MQKTKKRMCQEEKNAKNNFKPGFLMKKTSALSHFRTGIFQNGTKNLLPARVYTPIILQGGF